MGDEDEITGVYKSLTLSSVAASEYKILAVAVEEMLHELRSRPGVDEASINVELGVSALMLPKV